MTMQTHFFHVYQKQWPDENTYLFVHPAVQSLSDVHNDGEDGEGSEDNEDAHHVGDVQHRRRLILH